MLLEKLKDNLIFGANEFDTNRTPDCNLHTWNSLNMARPRPATISKSESNCLLSVVSLYGTHNANVRKSNIADKTSAPLPKFTCSSHVFKRFSKNCFDDSSDDLLSCSCFKLNSPLIECISEFNISIAAYVTARSLRLNDATTRRPIDSRNLEWFPWKCFCVSNQFGS